MDELRSLSEPQKDLFRSEVATKIYTYLNRQPYRFTELEEKTGCSPNSLTRNLRKGQRIGVWDKKEDHYRLTKKGKNLPEAVGKLGKLQQEENLQVGGKDYSHMNFSSGSSTVFEETESRSVTVAMLDSADDNDSDDEDSPNVGSTDWIGAFTG